MTDKFTLEYFIKMGLAAKEGGMKVVIEWCMEQGLIHKSVNCTLCGAKMHLVRKRNCYDEYQFQCRSRGKKPHNVRRSIRNDSFFSNSGLGLLEILKLSHLWVQKTPAKFIMHDLGFSTSTVADWTNLCREMCMMILLKESAMIGGENEVVHLYESEFFRQKWLKSKPVEGKWVFAGVQRGSTNTFFRVVPAKGKQTLLATIKDNILPGTTIFSDCWKSYNCLEDKGFIKLSENHSMTFKSTNGSKGMWNAMKWRKPTNKHLYDLYLAEYVWRRSRSDCLLITNEFLKGVAQVYFPDNQPAILPPDEQNSSTINGDRAALPPPEEQNSLMTDGNPPAIPPPEEQNSLITNGNPPAIPPPEEQNSLITDGNPPAIPPPEEQNSLVTDGDPAAIPPPEAQHFSAIYGEPPALPPPEEQNSSTIGGEIEIPFNAADNM